MESVAPSAKGSARIPALSAAKNPQEMLHFIVHFLDSLDGVRDLFAQQSPISLAQTMNRHSHRPFTQSEARCRLRLSTCARFTHDQGLKLVEQTALAFSIQLGFQPGQDGLEHR